MEMQRKTSKLMTAELSRKLVDSDLMHKYGTSLEINMSRDYQKNLDKKYQYLKSEFEKINKNSDDIITYQELSDFIYSYSSQTGLKYSDEYIKKIFMIMDIDQNQSVTLKEFIMSYIQLEESLRIKKIKYSKLQAELELQMNKEKKGMMDNNGEVFNHSGISKEASLNLVLLEARNLPSANFQGLSDPFVVLSLEGQKSKSAYKSNTLDPVWNENFNFQPSSKNAILNIEVWSKGNLYSSDTLLGKTEVFLENHVDQKKITLNLYLNTNLMQSKKSNSLFDSSQNKNYNNSSKVNFNSNNNENNLDDKIDNFENTVNPTIHISLQFLWNKLKYYTDNYNEIERKIDIIKKHIEELNYYCESFHKPFGLIISGNLTTLLEKRILDNDNDYSQIADDNRTKSKLITSPRNTNTRYTFTNKLQNVIKSTLRGHQIKWMTLSKTMIYLIILSSIGSLYDRPDFLNLAIGVVAFILLTISNSKNALNFLKLFLNLLLCSLLYDFIWIWLYRNNFDGLQKNNRHKILLVKGLIFLLGFGNFVFKIILSICVFIQINKTKINSAPSGHENINKSMMNLIPINLKGPNNIATGNDNIGSNNFGKNPFKTPIQADNRNIV